MRCNPGASWQMPARAAASQQRLAPFPNRPCPPRTGNLARFLNHSCSPNLMKQPVLVPGDSGLRYRMCFFAYG